MGWRLRSSSAKCPAEGAISKIALARDCVHVEAPAYDPAAIHGSRIPAADVRRVSETLLAMPRAERAALAVMHPGRVDVIGAGALILRVIVDEFGLDEVVVSEHDILDGIALRLARGRARPEAHREPASGE